LLHSCLTCMDVAIHFFIDGVISWKHERHQHS
jgi:hypothetical protein